MEADEFHTRSMLQEQILKTLATMQPERADELLDQVDVDGRESVLDAMLPFYAKHNQLARAIAIVYRIGQEKEVPYGSVARIMATLKPEQSADLQHDPRNTRTAVHDFSRPRGDIVSADGTVLAKSVPTNDSLQRVREYPRATAALFAHVTGFFSFTYGTEGVERSYNDDLAGKYGLLVSWRGRRSGQAQPERGALAGG